MSLQNYQSIQASKFGWKTDRFVLIAAILAILFSVCGIAMTSIIFSYDSNQQNQIPIACVPCRQLVKHPNDNMQHDPLISKLSVIPGTSGENKCCAYDSKQMSVLFELAMRQETATEPLQEFDATNFSFSPISAHKRLYPPTRETNSTGPQFEKELVMTRFKKEKSEGEHARGVDVQEEGLHIQTSGRYFIYSSIHFRPESSYPCKDLEFQTWGHNVEKITPNDPASSGCILKTAHTCCDECAGDDATSYTSGVFQLKQGDIIRIQVSGHGLVFFRKFSSFIGLMKLGGGDVRE